MRIPQYHLKEMVLRYSLFLLMRRGIFPCAQQIFFIYGLGGQCYNVNTDNQQRRNYLDMELTTIRELFKNREQYLDRKVTVGGWVRSIRDSKTFGFIVVNDGSFFETLQVVYHDKLDNFAEVSRLNVGAAVIVTGTLVATPQAKQPFEIQADEVQIEGASAPDYPLQKKRHSFEYLRTISHLRPRTNTFQAVFRVRSLAAYAIHRFFQERGFVYVHTPLITGSDCEGAG